MKQSLTCLAALMLGAGAALAAGKQLTGQHAPSTTPALAPADAQKKFVVPDGFEVRLFAAEPDVINPVAMTWDERGRLWVVELYEYPLGAAPGVKPRDCIKILEDTDNDGRADKVTVFADGLNLATGILLGNGGVYVGQAPDLLFLQDTNHDDHADTSQVLLTGFGLEDRHELLNGFTWGPDGWLYMTHGVFTHSQVKVPEATEPGIEMNAAVARFHPRTKKFEIFADGTSNPWGVDFDAAGNAFVSACVIDHLFHMAPGGIYQRQGGTPGNPYAYELLPSIVDHKHHMAAYCGICIYQGDQFPAEYRGRAFFGNIHQNAVNHDRLTPNGSSFKATAEKDFLTTSDGWFRPVSEQVGPDGALWIADWYDKYPCYQNARADPEGVDRERGRIWRVVYVGNTPQKKVPSRPNSDLDLAKLTNADLGRLLYGRNFWARRQALRLLTERLSEKNDEQMLMGLAAALFQKEQTDLQNIQDAKLWSFWVLLGSGNLTDDFFQRAAALQSSASSNQIFDHAVIRTWVARAIGQMRRPSEKNLSVLETLASDPNPSVRFAVAVAVRQLVAGSLTVNADINTNAPVGKILATLIRSSADAQDPLLPFMIWMAAEPLVAKNPAPGLQWLAENGAATMPLSGILTRKTMRRLCDTGDVAKMNQALLFLSDIAGKNDGLTLAALTGLIEGQQAKALRPTLDTKALIARLNESHSAPLQERTRQLGTIWGDASAIEKTLATINDTQAGVAERTTAIQSARQLKSDAAREALLTLIAEKNPEPLVIEALRALGEFDNDAVGGRLVSGWKNFTPAERAAAADVLVSRGRWVLALLSALETKTISSSELSASAIQKLGQTKDDFIRQRATQVIGKIRPADADKQKIIAAKKQMILGGGPPDLQAGHALAQKTCFVCHKLYGEGAEVGPDLTGVGRSSLDALLANVIDPNQIVGKGYESVEVETKDGRSVSGRLVEQTDQRVRLLAAGPKEEVIARSDIATLRVSELSLMPEGLEQMPDADFRNLIGYILNASGPGTGTGR